MNKTSIRSNHLLSRLIFLLLLIAGIFYNNKSTANPLSAQAPGVQLAYFIGYHSYDGEYRQPIYYPPKTYLKGGAYWTGWRYVGYGCRQTCLIDRVTHNALRCNKLCY